MRNFKFLNDITGWALFLISLIVYTLTIEPTASYWDPGEFIAVSYKLQVPHPPGAPFYLLTGRLFSMLAGSDVYAVAFWINMASAVCSALTIMFLYWTIVLLARKIGKVDIGKETPYQAALLLGSGIIGALAYTFSDSFWFSAVEAEVYAMSSFFMAIVFWAGLKWEVITDRQLENKWLILIAYIIGLSIGVHLLNLVAIPAMALIYYFKKYPTVNLKGIVISLLLGLIVVAIIMVGIIPGLPSLAGWFEIRFVNNLGLPFGSGMVFFSLLLLGGLVYGIMYAHREGKVLLNTALLSLAFILIGYSSYTMVVIRSNFDPPIDENNPENLISFVSYLKREQYGDRPLLYGNYFDAEVEDYKQGEAVYRKGEDKYEVAYYKQDYVFADDRKTIFPRAYSVQPNHKQLYRERMGLRPNEKPDFGDNLSYMFSYQMGHMYWRYFMWNFAGRASDIKDAGWLSPADAFDNNLPQLLAKNEGRNNFLMLPLLLGLIGAVFQYRRDIKGFGIVAMLFFLTGLALILYLNSPPIEPRERDYIYVGSFYAFAIWIGFGVYALGEALAKLTKKESVVIPAIATALCLLVPGIMAAEGWDDHDRSNRYFSVDSAKNFLASCAPNAILFTGGDNDTFPLWYAQEVEGFRTDVRVIVMTYFNTDWYIDQMTRKVNESEPLPFSLTKENYQQGGLNDLIYHVENKNLKGGALPLNQYINLVRQNHPAIRVSNRADEFNTIPSKTLALDVDTDAVMEMGIIPEGMEDLLTDRMVFQMKGGVLYKNDLMILDLLATNNWERPIYFNNTSLQSLNIDLTEYVIHEGTTYRLLPVRNPNPQAELVNTELMFDNLMNNFFWRELDNPDVYYSEDYRNFVLNHRSSFNTLAQALIDEGDDERARQALLRSLEVMPDEGVPFDYVSAMTVHLLLEVGEEERAIAIADLLSQRADETLAYLTRNNTEIGNERQKNLIILSQLSRTMASAGQRDKSQEYQELLAKHYGSMEQGSRLR